jgi:hypothetical protein
MGRSIRVRDPARPWGSVGSLIADRWDLVVSQGRTAVGIEVKAGTRFRHADLAALRTFVGEARQTRAGILAYNGTEALKIRPGILAVPPGVLLS